MHGAIARDDDGSSTGIVHWLTHHSTWSTTTYCYLEDLFVAPAVRGGGVGRSLIKHVRDWAGANGSDKVYWLTAETNTRAQALYNTVATRTGFIHYEIELRA
jgi:GNAT superfamily N-acetyltransferase